MKELIQTTSFASPPTCYLLKTEYILLVHHDYVIPNDMGLTISDQRNVGHISLCVQVFSTLKTLGCFSPVGSNLKMR